MDENLKRLYIYLEVVKQNTIFQTVVSVRT